MWGFARITVQLTAPRSAPAHACLRLQAGFPYIQAALRESFRIYPPSVTLLRETEGAWQLGGYHLPAGTPLQVSVLAGSYDSFSAHR